MVKGVKPKNQIWTTRIFCERHGVNVSKIEEVASDIAQQDNTFNYRIEKGDLLILSEDKDTAHQRGVWFINNVSELVKVMDEKKYEVYWEKKD